MLEGQKCVQRGVNGRRDRVTAESAQRVEVHHLIFEGDPTIALVESQQFVQIQRSKAFFLDASDVAAASLDPQNELLGTVQRILPGDFRASVSPAKISNAKVRAKKI